jgi:hypothetical protein
MAKMELGCLHLCRVAEERQKVEKFSGVHRDPPRLHFGQGGGWEIVIDAPVEIAKKEACKFPPRTALTFPALHRRLTEDSAAGAKANSLP